MGQVGFREPSCIASSSFETFWTDVLYSMHDPNDYIANYYAVAYAW